MAHGVTTHPDASQLFHLYTATGTSARHDASLGRVTNSHNESQRVTTRHNESQMLHFSSANGTWASHNASGGVTTRPSPHRHRHLRASQRVTWTRHNESQG